MARLPQPGGDSGTWGTILNEFLAESHNTDGTLKTNAVTPAALSSATPTTGQVLSYDGSNLTWTTVSGSGTVPDATSSVKGLVQLTGDLGGTAASPTVPGLASKENTITAGTTGQYYRGDKSWQTLDKSAVGLANVDNTSDANKPVSSATQTALNGKATDSAVVHNTGNETVAGIKTFSSSPIVPTPTTNSQAASKSYVDGVAASGAPDATSSVKGIIQLTGDLGGTAASPTVPGLASKADDSSVVHLTGTQTVAGVKTFSSSPIVPTPTTNTQAANKSYVDATAAAGAPDATSSVKGILQLTGDLGGTAASPTVPGLAGKANTTHSHAAGDITSGTMSTARLGSGTANSSTFLRGDGTWASPEGAILLTGTTAPSAGLGNDGDVYLDTQADAIYGPKTGGSWGSGTSMVGAEGPEGDAGPAGSDGLNGATKFTFMLEGAVTTGTGAIRLYNDTGRSLTIVAARATLSTAASSGATTVDVNINGSTILLSGNRPSIAAGGVTAVTTTIQTPSLTNGQYITVDVDAAGTGADTLVVEVTAQ